MNRDVGFDNTVIYYAVKHSGKVITPPLQTRNLAEAAIQGLSLEAQKGASIIQVDNTGRQFLAE